MPTRTVPTSSSLLGPAIRSRSRLVAAPATSPDCIAFAAIGRALSGQGKAVVAGAVCWPSMPTAWSTVTHTWEDIRSARSASAVIAPIAATDPSWLAECAPQLAAPFHNTPAEESTIAALLARTSMQIVLSVADVSGNVCRGSDADTHARRDVLADCLTAFARFAHDPGRRPCRMLVLAGDGDESDRSAEEDFARMRAGLPKAHWLKDVQLRFWKDAPAPLPSEIAQVAAAAVARRCALKETAHPIFDAVVTKVALLPPELEQLARFRRR